MSAQNPHWYSINEGIRYPIDESATGVDDTGKLVVDSIVTDLRLRWPSYLGKTAFISSLHVSAALVSVTVLATDNLDDSSEAVPLAVLTVPRPIADGKQYALLPQASGVGGWIVFGSGAEQEPYTARFSTARQSFITARAGRAYRQPAVSSLRASGAASKLTGLVLLRGDTPIEVVKGEREVNGVPQDVIVVRLADASVETSRDDTGGSAATSFYQQYAGPCGGRPDSGTCAKPPIEFINGVGPDCTGMITIHFKGYVSMARIAGEPGIVLSSPIGLSGACQAPAIPSPDGKLPSEVTLGAPPVVIPDPLPEDSISTYSNAESVGVVSDLPLSLNLDSGIGGFLPLAGAWSHGAHYTCTALTAANLAKLPLVSDVTVYRHVSARLRMPSGTGAARFRAGVMFNYRHGVMDPTKYVYYAAYLDFLNQQLVITRHNGSDFSIVGKAFVPNVLRDDWYDVGVTILPDGNPTYTKISAQVTGVTKPAVTGQLDVFVSDYKPSHGALGLFADRTVADFSYFSVSEAA